MWLECEDEGDGEGTWIIILLRKMKFVEQPWEGATGSLLYTGRLSAFMRSCVEHGLAEVIGRAQQETVMRGAMAPFELAKALWRGRFLLFEQHEAESEREVMEGYVLDDILTVAWRSTGPGRGPQLCLVAREPLPRGGRLVAARGALEPVSMRQGSGGGRQLWEVPGDMVPSTFLLSQRELQYSNITRYCMRSSETGQPANVVMEWERVFPSSWCCGVGILTVLGEDILGDSILYAL